MWCITTGEGEGREAHCELALAVSVGYTLQVGEHCQDRQPSVFGLAVSLPHLQRAALAKVRPHVGLTPSGCSMEGCKGLDTLSQLGTTLKGLSGLELSVGWGWALDCHCTRLYPAVSLSVPFCFLLLPSTGIESKGTY